MFKVEIEYEVGGRRYKDPSRAMDALSASLMEAVGEQVAQQLATVTCPEHGKRPKVTIVGRSADQINLQIDGCCQKLIDAANKKLN